MSEARSEGESLFMIYRYRERIPGYLIARKDDKSGESHVEQMLGLADISEKLQCCDVTKRWCQDFEQRFLVEWI